MAIIALCSFVLWKVYESTIDDYNYLGKAETSSLLGLYDSYAVSTDAKHCAKVGSALLAKGGSAVDAAIGTLLCMGVVLPNSLGLGGGCLMTIYDRSKKMATVIDGRETAPDYADEQMFVANPLSASRGPLSIGVPGELSAYWKAHQMFGKLNWSELFDGSIDLAENGHPMVEHLSYALKDWNHARYMTPALANMLTNNQTGKFLTEGELFVQKELANTLRRIRDNGAAEFYGGQTGQLFIDDLKLQGGKMTLENLQRYEAEVKQPLHFKLADDLHLYTQPPPGSGVVLSIIMRIMKELGYYKNLQPSASFEGSSLYYHHLVESFKFAYAKRAAIEDQPDDPKRMQDLMNEIMSDAFIKQSTARIDNVTHNSEYYGGVQYFQNDHGTAHVSVVDGQGNAAAVTTSVNLYFGSGLYSPRTGIIYNDVMDDFVSPNITNRFNLMPSQFNRIRPGRRPLSSMAPSIFTDSNGDVRLVIGASGGAKITTAIATVSIRNLYLGEDIKSSIDGHRIHHQYLPDVIWHEHDFPKSLLYSLGERGHKITPIVGRSSVVMAIANDTHKITANSDYRKGGLVAGI